MYVTQKSAVPGSVRYKKGTSVLVSMHITRGTFARLRFPHRHIGVIMRETPSPTTGAGAQNKRAVLSPAETDATRRRARQSIREYELI